MLRRQPATRLQVQDSQLDSERRSSDSASGDHLVEGSPSITQHAAGGRRSDRERLMSPVRFNSGLSYSPQRWSSIHYPRRHVSG